MDDEDDGQNSKVLYVDDTGSVEDSAPNDWELSSAGRYTRYSPL